MIAPSGGDTDVRRLGRQTGQFRRRIARQYVSYTEHRQCRRKCRYVSREIAERSMERLKLEPKYDGRPLHTYACEYCSGWHVGHVRGGA